MITKLTKRIRIPEKIFEIVRLEDNIIGTMMGVIVGKKFLYIADVLVHPDYRRKNIASTMLYQLIHQWAEKKGTQYVWLQVEENNKIAYHFK